MDTSVIVVIIDLSILMIVEVFNWIYILTIICLKRFHTTTYLLIGNFCLTSAICGIFWIIHNLLSTLYPSLLIESRLGCFINRICPDLFNSLPIYSLVMITINRCLTINYSQQGFFKRPTWFLISITVQGIIIIIFCIPQLFVGVLVNIHCLKTVLHKYRSKKTFHHFSSRNVYIIIHQSIKSVSIVW